MNIFVDTMKKISLGLFISILTINLQAMVSPDNSQLIDAIDEDFESQVLSDEELEEIYSAEIIKADEKKILEQEATSILSDYLVLYDEEFYVLDVPTEIYNDLSTELKNVVEASQYSIQLYNEGTLLLDEEGTLILAESAEEFVIQDSNIEFIGQYVMVWFVNVWVGYDIVAKPGVWSTILAVIFLVVGTASLIYDILTFDKDTYARIAYFYTGTMFTIMSQAVSTISKIPQYIVTGILTLMRFSSSVVSATISLVVTFLKMVFPPAVHASEMLSAISKGKSFIVHYNTILYSSYSII